MSQKILRNLGASQRQITNYILEHIEEYESYVEEKEAELKYLKVLLRNANRFRESPSEGTLNEPTVPRKRGRPRKLK